MCAGGFITLWLWENGRAEPAASAPQGAAGRVPPFLSGSRKIFIIPAAVYNHPSLWKCRENLLSWMITRWSAMVVAAEGTQEHGSAPSSDPVPFAASGRALLHPRAPLCHSATLLQLHRVPQTQSPFASLCSCLPGALLLCWHFLPQLQ